LEIKQRKLLSQKAYDKRASRGIRFQTDQYTGIGAIALMFCAIFWSAGNHSDPETPPEPVSGNCAIER
jgi:hypothetical protein